MSIDKNIAEKYMKRLRKHNCFNDRQIAMILSCIADNNIDIYCEYMSKAFMMSMGIVLNVLLADYWPKADKKKLNKFMWSVTSLFEATDLGYTKWDEIAEYIYDQTGVVLEADWLTKKDRETSADCIRLGRRKQ